MATIPFRPKNFVTIGSVNGSPIVTDTHDNGVGTHPFDQITVRLSAAYTRAIVPGTPEVPPPGQEVKKRIASGGPIASNTTLTLHAHEASALVAAGAAVYV